jgi:hypothetical protein
VYHGSGAKVGSGATVGATVGTGAMVGATVGANVGAKVGAKATGAVGIGRCCLSLTGPARVLRNSWPVWPDWPVRLTSVNVILSSSASTSTKYSPEPSRLNRVGTNEANVVPLLA